MKKVSVKKVYENDHHARTSGALYQDFCTPSPVLFPFEFLLLIIFIQRELKIATGSSKKFSNQFFYDLTGVFYVRNRLRAFPKRENLCQIIKMA